MKKGYGLAMFVVYWVSLCAVIAILAVRVWNKDQQQENANVESDRMASALPRHQT